jgi:hypothetical protein
MSDQIQPGCSRLPSADPVVAKTGLGEGIDAEQIEGALARTPASTRNAT